MKALLVVAALIVATLLIPPSLTSAAYPDSATVLGYEQDQNGSARLRMRFTGNAGEPIVDRYFSVGGSSPAEAFSKLQQWIRSVVTELNLARTAGTHPSVSAGTVISGAAAPAPVVTPRALWRSKVLLYVELSSQGFTGALGTALEAMKTDIETTYQAGYLDVN